MSSEVLQPKPFRHVLDLIRAIIFTIRKNSPNLSWPYNAIGWSLGICREVLPGRFVRDPFIINLKLLATDRNHAFHPFLPC